MINAEAKMAGRFKITRAKVGENGEPVEETREVVADWFDNLILDQGLDALGTRNWDSPFNQFHVGTGSTAPTTSDTGLESPLATTSNEIDEDTGATQDGSNNWYVYRTATHRFVEGDAAGNLSEIGAGWSASNNDLFSRALIQDSNGDPTSITVLPDESLDVTYELRVYPPTVDYTGTVDLGGVTYDYTARACNVSNYGANTGWDIDSRPGTGAQWARVYSGGIGGITGAPSGDNDIANSYEDGSYVGGSYEGSGTSTWNTGAGNFQDGVRAMDAKIGPGIWQIEFESQADGSAIPKVDTQELSFTVTHSWARA